ncbi:hypothetical protein DE4576_05563 [Mycobacterium marinum]|nr:hypothetical protein DE4576_05563 [Mycobacterium marinum]
MVIEGEGVEGDGGDGWGVGEVLGEFGGGDDRGGGGVGEHERDTGVGVVGVDGEVGGPGFEDGQDGEDGVVAAW